MKKRYLFLALFCFILNFANAQVGIGTTIPDVSSELDISSPLNNKGVLIPRMTLAQRNTIVTPATSLLIYQTDSTPGFYYFNGTIWNMIQAGVSTDWSLLGNTGTSATTNFLGTTDDVDVVLKRNNIRAGLIGNPGGAATTVNTKNTVFGANSLLNPATGYRNTVVGSNAMTANTSGKINVSIGDATLASNTTGSENVAIGVGSLFSNTFGYANVALGRNALTTVNGTTGTQGVNNTAVGYEAIRNSTTGQNNTAIGRAALRNNGSGDNNVAVGYQSGLTNTGSNNITIGKDSEVPVLANSDQLSLGNVIYGKNMTSTSAGLIGIGESNPTAKLQISSSNQITPAITDGVLIPKVDNLTTIPTAAQQGMLVYLTTLSGSNPSGFYYWNNAPPSWIGLNSTLNGDHDWYEEGTTIAPNAITDDMFHIGNVAIGKNTADYPLDILTTNNVNGIYNELNNNTNAGSKVGILNNVLDTSTDDKIGLQNNVTSNGNSLFTVGISNLVGSVGTQLYGTSNTLSGFNGTQSNLDGTRNTISVLTGANNNVNGVYNILTPSRSGFYNGVNNLVTNSTGAGFVSGVSNQFSGNTLTENTGVNTSINVTGAADVNGVKNQLRGEGLVYGVKNELTGNQGGFKFGVFNDITNTGNGTHYGVRTDLTGTGTGIKYSNYNFINATAGGTHYGVYSEVLKAGATNFAGYFLGNVGIGTTTANIYTLPASRGTNLQIMQSNAAGGVTWQNPSTALNSSAWLTTGNSGMTANFLGTTDANPLAFRANNTERMRIVPTGEVVIGATIPGFTGDTFGVISPSGGFAINGYASGTGTGVYAETGTGNGVWGQGATGVGVRGQSTGTGIGVAGFNSGTGIAVLGNNAGGGTGVDGRSVLTGIGVSGTNTGTGIAIQGINSGTGNGVVGQSTSTAFGVLGTNSGTGNGVRGTSVSTGIGVIGFNSATGVGVQGQSVTSGFGVLGFNTGTGVGIQGQNSSTGPAVVGLNTGTGNGVVGQSTSTAFGVLGTNSGTGNGVRGTSASTGIGVIGFNSATGVGVQGQNSSTGSAIFGANTSTGFGVVGQTPVGSTSFAVFANGNMGASGTKPFYIDHPTDPENKYLRHFALESNEVLNVYRGNVILDSNGEAIVTLPNYFDEVNKNFSYNLTSIGSKSEVFIKDEIANNQFKIAGGNPNQKISWQVYAERNDLYLQKYPENRKVEVDKNNNDRGKYLMPELFNQSKEKGIFNSSVNEIEPNTSNNSSLKSGIVISPKNEELNVSKQTINTPEANTTFAKKEKKTK